MTTKLSTHSSSHAAVHHGDEEIQECPKSSEVKRSADITSPVYCTCKIKKQRFKYVQPKQMPSYKPIKVYKQPAAHLDGKTVYKMSYPGCDGEAMKKCRGSPIIPMVNLVSSGKFSDQTTNKHDYIPWSGTTPADPIYPDASRLIGEGPMSTKTTHRHDYIPKPLMRTDPIKHENNLVLSNKKMEDTSTMNASYQPIKDFDPMKSYKPLRCYKPASSPIEDKTVNKLSYVPHPVPEKEEFPWALKKKYESPVIPFDGHTIYNNSYLPSKICERQSAIKHADAAHLLSYKTNFDERTVYKESYKPTDEGCRPKAVIPHDNLTVSNAKLMDQTTHKHDYTPWRGAVPADPIYPDASRLIGEGQMSNLTTHRHDYVPKSYFRNDPIKPRHNLSLSDKKMEDTSVMAASFQPIKNFRPSQSYQPKRCFKVPSTPIEDKTVQKLSYVPWPVPEKEELPWNQKRIYKGPKSPFDDNTVYNNSYRTPGMYVPIHDEECAFAARNENKGQLCRYKGECISTY